MLRRRLRLTRRRDFEAVYRRGRFWTDPLLALHLLPAGEGRRVGVVVGRKLGGAVVRNRVRRRLRELLRPRMDQWKSGVRVIVVARAAAAGASLDELATSLDRLARRAGLELQPGDSTLLYRLPPRIRS